VEGRRRQGLLGFTSTAGIDPVIPLLLFVILFGLSMDYHVFIVSRIRELSSRGTSTDEAVAQGVRSTAGVVTRCRTARRAGHAAHRDHSP
jgi:RND superfamily putative drug exporter